MIATAMLPLPERTKLRWFSTNGCIEVRGDRSLLFVGGTLVGEFSARDRGLRNVLVVSLSSDPGMHLGHLATAFGIHEETLRLLRRAYEERGLEALWRRVPGGGGRPKVTPALRARLEREFEAGASVTEAHRALGRRGRVSRATVGTVRAAWWANRRMATESTPSSEGPQQPLLPATREAAAVPVRTPASDAPASVVAPEEQSQCGTEGGDDEGGAAGSEPPIEEKPVAGGGTMQHLGTWLMIAMVARLGLHRRAEATREGRVTAAALRIAIDAAVAALAIGQRCVEGVRRLATPTAGWLLRAAHAPSATWVRRILGRFARELGGVKLHLGMAAEYARAARSSASEAVVFYVDNHLRPYTGQQVVRKGWRMQDKRVLPGVTDYYVHDEDGRPLMRMDVPSHDSLTDWLPPIARLLRMALGSEQRILLAFDRGGAFPGHMAELRDEGFSFVTYERRPYPLLAATAFDRAMKLDGEKIRLHEEARKNLGQGRGRVRRIALLMPEGRQVNLLAIGDEPAKRLVEVMRGRWNQENGLKHGVERWGINQLDGRRVDPYPPDAVVPNPARRRLDRALRIARVREGDLRSALARLGEEDAKRERLERDLADAMALERQLEAQRPWTPTHAPLAETELAGQLVQHRGEYKAVLDTLRIACANAESDLAGELGRHLQRPAEAKKTLANLLAAPGHVRVGKTTLVLRLQPAGTRSELEAFAALLCEVNHWNLTLPGDRTRRRLRFAVEAQRS